VRPTRGKLLVLLAVALACLVVVAVDAGRSGRGCLEWRGSYEEILATRGGAGALDFVNAGPLADLRREKPPNCEIPG
jgi:hypothetical protein